MHMKHKSLKLTTGLMLVLGLTNLQAQKSVSVSGGDTSGSGGSVSYSVGQTVYQMHSGATGSQAQGVQQPYEISTVTGIDKSKLINFSAKVYPNPTSDYLILRIEDFERPDLSYELTDMSGKPLQSKIITDKETQINTMDFVPATYFLKVKENSQEIKTFKIIKN